MQKKMFKIGINAWQKLKSWIFLETEFSDEKFKKFSTDILSNVFKNSKNRRLQFWNFQFIIVAQ